MKLSVIIAAGVGTLALAGVGCSVYMLTARNDAVAPVVAMVPPVMEIAADTPPPKDDWRSLENYGKLGQASQSTDEAEAETPGQDQHQDPARAARLADLRSRINPPLLPLQLVADARVTVSPKSHWDTDTPAAKADTRAAGAAKPVGTVKSANSANLVSQRTQETIATLEAFKTALRATGSEGKFPVLAASGKAAVVAPYIER